MTDDEKYTIASEYLDVYRRNVGCRADAGIATISVDIALDRHPGSRTMLVGDLLKAAFREQGCVIPR